MATKESYIKVKAVEDHGRVILFERSDLHPEIKGTGVKEAFIKADPSKTYEVGETPKVLTLLANGKLKKA